MPVPAKPDVPAPSAKPSPPPEPPPPVAPRRASAVATWLPLIMAVVVGPLVTWATIEFVMVPRLRAKLSAPLPAPAAAAAKEGAGPAKPSDAGYEFSSVIVNLAGTMGTRYLKTSFVVVGDRSAGVDIQSVFTENRTKLYDTTLNVLSSLTLADLEEAGAKNVIREKLVSAYNQALGRHVADQVYFSDFVVQ